LRHDDSSIHHLNQEDADMPAENVASFPQRRAAKRKPTVHPDGPATERAIDIAIKAQILALSLKITPSTFSDALPPLMRDKVTANLDVIFPWLKALEVIRHDD
jgi:hypothetical protein